MTEKDEGTASNPQGHYLLLVNRYCTGVERHTVISFGKWMYFQAFGMTGIGVTKQLLKEDGCSKSFLKMQFTHTRLTAEQKVVFAR